jgi:hypothetical protein
MGKYSLKVGKSRLEIQVSTNKKRKQLALSNLVGMTEISPERIPKPLTLGEEGKANRIQIINKYILYIYIYIYI